MVSCGWVAEEKQSQKCKERSSRERRQRAGDLETVISAQWCRLKTCGLILENFLCLLYRRYWVLNQQLWSLKLKWHRICNNLIHSAYKVRPRRAHWTLLTSSQVTGSFHSYKPGYLCLLSTPFHDIPQAARAPNLHFLWRSCWREVSRCHLVEPALLCWSHLLSQFGLNKSL